MKRKALAAIFLSTLLISACSSNEATSSSKAQSNVLKENETKNIKE